jgi:hypothetical protein
VIGPEHKISAVLQKRTLWSAFAAAESANILDIARRSSSVRHNGRRSLHAMERGLYSVWKARSSTQSKI